jgi:tRNA(Arg) A34 adenosine deaminase TadA
MSSNPSLTSTGPRCTRRSVIATVIGFALVFRAHHASASAGAAAPELRWYEAAASMKRLAESWGDQPYGAVLVLDGVLVGAGPSRVVKNRDPDAHAEREAIRDAQERLGRSALVGAVLYSTSRPCNLCEAAAARAGVRRMYFGASLTDAGGPGSAGK